MIKTFVAGLLKTILTKAAIKKLAIELITYLVAKTPNTIDDKLLPDIISAIKKL